ncbi:hypothetical protein [Streptomyces sp. NPDC055749]
MADGQLGFAEAADGLIRTQRFLDRRLNRRHEVERSWPDFPPDEVKAMLAVHLPRDWTLMEPSGVRARRKPSQPTQVSHHANE